MYWDKFVATNMYSEGTNFLKNHPNVKAFLIGSFSGSISTLLFQPLDVVKTHLQNPSKLMKGPNVYLGMSATFSEIFQKEHIRGLWKGTMPSLLRSVPSVGLYFGSLHYMQYTFLDNELASPSESIIMGVAARSLAEVSLMPVTVVKTRLESGVYTYNTTLSALKEIYLTEGLKGMTRGMVPSLFRDAPFSGLFIMFYTQAKKTVPNELLSSVHASPIHFSCAFTASILATLLTQPPDVIKTKMQVHPKKFRGIWHTIIYIKAKYGFSGFFKGTFPRMLRKTLVAGITWTIYERLSKEF